MLVTRFACPACQLILQPGNPLEEGRKIKCQQCGVIFPIKRMDQTSAPQPALVAAAPTFHGATPPRPRKRRRGPEREYQSYEQQMEKSRNTMIAIGGVVVLLLLTAIVVGLFALSGDSKSSDKVAAQRPASSSGSGSSFSVPPETSGSGTNAEEETKPADEGKKPNDDMPSEYNPGGGGPMVTGAGSREKPKMPGPGEFYPGPNQGGGSGARGPTLPGAPGSGKPNNTPPGYPPGYEPPANKDEGSGDAKPDDGKPKGPFNPPPAQGSSGPQSVGGGPTGPSMPGGGRMNPPGRPGQSTPNYPGTPPQPGGPGNSGTPRAGGPGGSLPPGAPGANNPAPGYPPNSPPPMERDPTEGTKPPDVPTDWPKFRREYPNQGLEISFNNTLRSLIVVGIRSDKTEKGFGLGTDLNVQPGQSTSAHLRNGSYEIFLVDTDDADRHYKLGTIQLAGQKLSYRIVKENGNYVLQK